MPRRSTALALAPLALLLVSAPAVAQTASPTPSDTPTYNPDPAPPTPTPHSQFACPVIDIGPVRPALAVSGDLIDIPVTIDNGNENATATVTLARRSPAPFAEVRRVQSTRATVFQVRLGESHEFQVDATRDRPCSGGRPNVTVLVGVKAKVSIAAVRNAARDYTFSGRVQPAHGTVSLYRVEASGRRVLTARADVQRDGTYRIERRFTGSGRFGFVTVASAGSTGRYNSGSESPVRPTVIH